MENDPGTKRFILLRHPSGTYARVKQGFSWPALLFGSLWAIVRRMWLLAAVLLAVDIVLWVAGGYAAHLANPALLFLFLVANIVYLIVRGQYGNRWRLAFLRRSGYVPVPVAQEPAGSPPA